MEIKVGLNTEKKQYNDLTIAQLTKMVEYMNQGMTEEEAKAKAIAEA